MVRLELRYPFREDQDQKGNPEAKQTRDGGGGGGRQKATTEVGHSPTRNKAKQIAPLKLESHLQNLHSSWFANVTNGKSVGAKGRRRRRVAPHVLLMRREIAIASAASSEVGKHSSSLPHSKKFCQRPPSLRRLG